MKKLFVILFALLATNIARAQNYVTIPDANFVKWLQATIPSAMNGNLMDTSSVAVKTILTINVENKSIKDLTGIQYFSSLVTLDCYNQPGVATPNSLTFLPPLPNKLNFLSCYDNQITNLPVLPNSLKELLCYSNQITSIPALPNSLTWLNCSSNQITSLPESLNSLTILDCSSNQITSLPALPNSLTNLHCAWNQITSLPALPNSLNSLGCSANQITSLPALPNSLTDLECFGNQLTSLPALPDSLTWLICSGNQITSLPVLPNSLTYLDCSANRITSLPALPNSLTKLNCSYNQITSLPVLPNSLTDLACSDNQINSLPVLPNSLTWLYCSDNQITSLPALPNSLTKLNCSDNLISRFPTLPNTLVDPRYFYISGNPFTCLPNYVPAMNAGTLAFPLCITGDTINNKHNCSGFNGIIGSIYKDNNSNCTKDATDLNLANIHAMLYNNSGKILSQTYSAINGIYNFPNSAGTYTVKIDITDVPFLVQCSNPGIDSTITLTTDHPMVSDVNFSFGCKPGFDVGVQSATHSGIVFPGQKHSLNINAGDMSNWYQLHCAAGIGGQVQVTVNGPVTYIGTVAGALKPTVAGKVFTYTIPDFGTINFKTAFGLILATETTAQSGDEICVQVKVSPVSGDSNPENNTYNYCYLVVNSYDPNMKEVYPTNVLPGYNDYFTYTVHFQNTGTANAINIRIVDALSTNFDLSTFQVMNYSHINTVSLEENILTVRFPNIQLPDSTSNPEGSNGSIQYHIKPKANLPIGTKINNTASIYFDYNAPVATNTTTNLYTTTVSVKESRINISSVSIYPNPTNGSITIESWNTTPQEYFVSITNMQGQEVFSEKIFFSGKHALNVSNLNDGVYIISMGNKKENYRSKIIIQK